LRIAWEKAANLLTSVAAGFAAFAFTLYSFLMLRDLDEQVMAAFTVGLFAVTARAWLLLGRS
jgi:hypothetical protein